MWISWRWAESLVQNLEFIGFVYCFKILNISIKAAQVSKNEIVLKNKYGILATFSWKHLHQA